MLIRSITQNAMVEKFSIRQFPSMFPDILKQAEICPIFKKENAMNACNYRPVSILPIVSKIYEK